MDTLPKFLGSILSLASLLVAGKLVYDNTILQFWTTQWTIGVLLTLVFLGVGLSLLGFADERLSKSAAAWFGIIYAAASALIYIVWGLRHVKETLYFGEFIGFLFLWGVVVGVAFTGLTYYTERASSYKVFFVPAWFYALANLGVLMGVTLKYVFAGGDWSAVPFAGEIIVIVIGSITCFISYGIATDGPSFFD